jgi:diguanylate cyclase (GGDEF)-like protein
MTFDPATVAVMSGLIVTLCGVTFIMNTTLRRNDVVSRIWSVAFIAAILQTLSYAVWSLDPASWWGLAVGNGAYAAAVGLFWSGLRRGNARSSLLWIPPLAGTGVALAVVLRGPDGGAWAGAAEMFLVVAAFAVLGTIETLSGKLRRSLNARILTVIFIVVGVFYVGRTIGLLALGPDDPVFLGYFGPIPAILINLCLIILATVALSIIQIESHGLPGRVDSGTDTGGIDGIVGSRAFRGLAESWLLRSVRERSTLVLMVLELVNLDEINVAFGRPAGDRSIRLVGRVTATQAPAPALVGQLAADRFALLIPLPSTEDVSAVVDRISAAILHSQLDDADRFRASVLVGVASTRTSGSRYDGLLDAAMDAAREAAETAAIRAGDEHAPESRWRS